MTHNKNTTKAKEKIRIHNNNVQTFVSVLDEWAMRDINQMPQKRFSKNRCLKRWSFHEKLDACPEIKTDSFLKSMVPGSKSVIASNMIHEKQEKFKENADGMGSEDFDPFVHLMEITLLSQTLLEKDSSIMISDLHAKYNTAKVRTTGQKKSFADVVAENDSTDRRKKSLLETARGRTISTDLYMKMYSALKEAKTDEEKTKVLADMISVSKVLDHNIVQRVFKKIRAEEAA